MVKKIAAARSVNVFYPVKFFVADGRTLDSRIPYLPWTVMISTPLFSAFSWLPIFVYSKTRSGTRKLFRLYSGVIGVTVAALARAWIIRVRQIHPLASAVTAIFAIRKLFLRITRSDHFGHFQAFNRTDVAAQVSDPIGFLQPES